MNEDIYERVAKLETITSTHDKQITKLTENQGEKNEVLTRLTVIMESQTERDKKQNEQLNNFGETLSKVNDNLRELNVSQHQLKNEVSQMGSRITNIEHTAEEKQKSRKQTIINLLKYIGVTLVTGVLTYYGFQ